MKKVILPVLVTLIFLGAFGMFFYLKAQETVEKMVLGVKNVRLQNAEIADTQKELPAADVTGEEMLGLTRYPAAVRTGFVKKEMAAMASYQVKATSEDVLKFYEMQMVAGGWGEALAENGKMIFVKDENKVTIMGRTNSFGITTFQIILEKF